MERNHCVFKINNHKKNFSGAYNYQVITMNKIKKKESRKLTNSYRNSGYIVLGLLRRIEGSPLIVNCVTGL